MAVKFWKKVSNAMKLEQNSTFFWTDSMVVLHWLKSPSYTYVANRVALVLEECGNHQWLHVKGSENPADIVSRGTLPEDLLEKAEWFHGPQWLHSTDVYNFWENADHLNLLAADVPKRRKVVLTVVKAEQHPILDRFSEYWKMLRITACMRIATRGEKKGKFHNL
uniref:Uncharacterized protein n=1 Tax=Anopheles gambiae TaxID=7165 RepID=A0A0E4G8U7_ANOGA